MLSTKVIKSISSLNRNVNKLGGLQDLLPGGMRDSKLILSPNKDLTLKVSGIKLTNVQNFHISVFQFNADNINSNSIFKWGEGNVHTFDPNSNIKKFSIKGTIYNQLTPYSITQMMDDLESYAESGIVFKVLRPYSKVLKSNSISPNSEISSNFMSSNGLLQLGDFVITEFSNNMSHFIRSTTPQKSEFSITLKKAMEYVSGVEPTSYDVGVEP